MSKRNVSELRNYLRHGKEEDPEFQDFLDKVDFIVKLRLAAERQFRDASHTAFSKRLALPLGWLQIKSIAYPGQKTPPETLITSIARNCLNETESLIGNMRKVLLRQRAKVSLGLVQQVDSHCLRWLSKQPGRNAIEKAGAKQKILGVVRRENFNTLENRVFKDFLARSFRASDSYLKDNEKKFIKHPTIKQVKRLKQLCAKGMQDPILQEVKTITSLPTPNYVLRQDRRYGKIWKVYCELLRQANFAERLWAQKEELEVTCETVKAEACKQTDHRAIFHCPLWLNNLDGRKTILDKPFYVNEFATKPIVPSSLSSTSKDDGDRVIDLTGQQPDYDLLIYGNHENAKPYLQDYTRPSIEDLEGKHHIFLRDLLSHAKADDLNTRRQLADYFEQLKGKIGGKRWFVLVPDDWDALWQETIIKTIPLARSDIFLLWRSIATSLGVLEQLKKPCNGDSVAIVDIQQGGIARMCKIFLVQTATGDRLIPQRKSFLRHTALYHQVRLQCEKQASMQDGFLFGNQDIFSINESNYQEIDAFCRDANHVVLVDTIGTYADNNKWFSDWLVADGEILNYGVQLFIQQRNVKQVSYYDELEALSLVVQTKFEQIDTEELVPADEYSPGGEEVITEIIKDAAVLKSHSKYVDLYLCMGETTPDAPLKRKQHDFQRMLENDHSLDFSARITPGQGMALVTVLSDFLREPIELDFLHGMEDADLTIAGLEKTVQRSFPPDAPHVESDSSLWNQIRFDIQEYLEDLIFPNGDWFAKARNKYTFIPLPKNAGPLEQYRRINVFGNREGLEYQPDCDRARIFSKMAQDYNTLTGKNRDAVIRLIAWTYASHEPLFYQARNDAVMHLLRYAKKETTTAPSYPEITLCANLCLTPKEWKLCLQAIELRIGDYNNSVSRDFYLLYNLLQFHPTLLYETGYYKNDKCWGIARHIPYWYRRSLNSSVTIGYILKSILYLLRCRRFDGKKFLTQGYEPKRYAQFYECLNTNVDRKQERLRKLTKEYLNNKGTIDGLPVN